MPQAFCQKQTKPSTGIAGHLKLLLNIIYFLTVPNIYTPLLVTYPGVFLSNNRPLFFYFYLFHNRKLTLQLNKFAPKRFSQGHIQCMQPRVFLKLSSMSLASLNLQHLAQKIHTSEEEKLSRRNLSCQKSCQNSHRKNNILGGRGYAVPGAGLRVSPRRCSAARVNPSRLKKGPWLCSCFSEFTTSPTVVKTASGKHTTEA